MEEKTKKIEFCIQLLQLEKVSIVGKGVNLKCVRETLLTEEEIDKVKKVLFEELDIK